MTAALNGGEDYRLLFTIPIGYHDKFRHDFQTFDIIGHLAKPDVGAVIVTPGGVELQIKAQGWVYFTIFSDYLLFIITYFYICGTNNKKSLKMTEWWTSLDLFMKILWSIAIATSLIFIIETILTFIGIDHEIDADFDTSMDGGFESEPSMNLYTFRNLVNFLLGMSWTAILLKEKIVSTALLMVIAVAVGVMLVAAVMYMFKWLSKMQQSGNIDVYKCAVGCIGKVYLTIPAQRKGAGKVQITINEAVREYDALTDSENELKTGASIKVIEVLDSSTLLVEEMNSLII